MSVIKQLSIPDHDTWTISYVNDLAKLNKLSPTIIRALKFYDKYQHLLEDDGTLPGLIDMIKQLQSQVQELDVRIENVKFVTTENGTVEVDSDDWLSTLEEIE